MLLTYVEFYIFVNTLGARLAYTLMCDCCSNFIMMLIQNAVPCHKLPIKITIFLSCTKVFYQLFLFMDGHWLTPLSHYRVSTHVSTAYQDTKGTSRVRRTYASIRSSYSSIRSTYAEVLRFLCVRLKIRSTYVAGPIRRTYVTHTWYIRKQRGRYAVDT